MHMLIDIGDMIRMDRSNCRLGCRPVMKFMLVGGDNEVVRLEE